MVGKRMTIISREPAYARIVRDSGTARNWSTSRFGVTVSCSVL
jgi:hypothetical protein